MRRFVASSLQRTITRSLWGVAPQYASFRARLISVPGSQCSSRYGPVPSTSVTIACEPCFEGSMCDASQPESLMAKAGRGDLRQECDIGLAQLEDHGVGVRRRDAPQLAGIRRVARIGCLGLAARCTAGRRVRHGDKGRVTRDRAWPAAGSASATGATDGRTVAPQAATTRAMTRRRTADPGGRVRVPDKTRRCSRRDVPRTRARHRWVPARASGSLASERVPRRGRAAGSRGVARLGSLRVCSGACRRSGSPSPRSRLGWARSRRTWPRITSGCARRESRARTSSSSPSSD